MLKPNNVVFMLDQYDDKYEDMWRDISMMIKILINANYVCKVYADDGPDIIVVEYIEADEELAEGAFIAAAWDEIEKLEYYNEVKNSPDEMMDDDSDEMMDDESDIK